MNRSPHDLKSVMVIRLGSLGDVVLTTLLVRRLRDKFPDIKIDLLTKRAYLPLLEGFPPFNDTITMPQKALDRWRLRRRLSKSRYSVIIDLQNNLASRLVSRWMRPRRIYRFHRLRFNRWLRIHAPSLRSKLKMPDPVPLQYLNLAAPLGVTNDEGGLLLQPIQSWIEAAGFMLKPHHQTLRLPSNNRPLLFSPGARHATKIWPRDRWIKLATVAYQAGFTSQVIIGGDDDEALATEIAGAVDHPILNTAGKTELGALVGLISSASLLISSDSGPMHIAAAVGTPVVSIFGPTVPEFGFAPFRCTSKIVQIDDLNCRPCHPHGPKTCPKGHFRCMKDITVEMVFEAVRELSSLPESDSVIEHAPNG